MKKLLLTSALFFLLLFPQLKLVNAGPQCDALGGVCRVSCSGSEDNQGVQDCPSNPGIPGRQEVCCTPKAVSSPTPTPTTAVGAPAQIAEPIWPVPGYNCGVATDQEIKVCCSNPIDSWEVSISFPQSIKDIPFIGKAAEVFEKLGGVINLIIDEMPFPLIGHMLPLPTVGKAKTAMENLPLCIEGNPIGDPTAGTCSCEATDSASLYKLKKYCDNISSSSERNACANCFDTGGIWTGLTCIKVSLSAFIQETVFTWGIGLAGMIAILCIIYAAFMLQTSQGNPERIKRAQEMLTSCIMGLVLIIFSVFILKIIGVDILKIPGFGK